MRNVMRVLMTLALVLPVFALASFGRPDVDAVADDARIIGIQKIDASAGVAYTRDSLFRTHDNGQTWHSVDLALDDIERIAWLYLLDERIGWSNPDRNRGWAILVNTQNPSLRLALTSDGGLTWFVQPIDLGAADLVEANLLSATLGFSSDRNRLSLQIPYQTSSNFVAETVYESKDEGRTWEFRYRYTFRKNSEPQLESQGRSEDWALRSDGVCFGFKSGCVQETRILSRTNEITPPAIKAEMDLARQAARHLARQEILFFPPGGATRTSLNRGFDKCTAGTVAQMQTWWNNSPLYDSNIYISGRNRGCSQPQLNASWVNQVSAMGWGLIPTIVGYQSPCSVCANCQKHSSDAPTAETQGRGEADIAVADATNLGLTAGSILYYDMERYDETVSTPGCRTATTTFLKGWTERVRELGYKSGTYGSPRNAIDDWQFMPPASRMEAVWMARWDNVPSVWTYVSFANFPNNVWDNHQRIKQWQAPHDETWGGVTFNIDGNIADGPVAGVAVAKNKNADFDGDGRTDVSVFRPDNGVWYVLNSSNATVTYTQFGQSGDVPAPGDYDGDGRTDPAVFRPSDGIWHMLTKANTYSARQWGVNGDIPVAADYNGDGKTDLALFRPSNGVWYIVNSDSLGTFTGYGWGTTGDKPVVGDYDGDGKSDIAIYRPSDGVWYVVRSSDGGFSTTLFGLSADLPAQGDFDGDGKTDRVVFRPSDGVWYILRSSEGAVNYYTWGIGGDLPVTGDYDGDNKADVGLFRPSNGGWYVIQSGGGFQGATWGAATDAAVPNAYLPR